MCRTWLCAEFAYCLVALFSSRWREPEQRNGEEWGSSGPVYGSVTSETLWLRGTVHDRAMPLRILPWPSKRQVKRLVAPAGTFMSFCFIDSIERVAVFKYFLCLLLSLIAFVVNGESAKLLTSVGEKATNMYYYFYNEILTRDVKNGSDTIES